MTLVVILTMDEEEICDCVVVRYLQNHQLIAEESLHSAEFARTLTRLCQNVVQISRFSVATVDMLQKIICQVVTWNQVPTSVPLFPF